MALVLNERVKETTTTTGTGALSLGGAPTGFETFAAGIGNSNTTYYAIFHATADEFEVGQTMFAKAVSLYFDDIRQRNEQVGLVVLTESARE